MLGSGLIQGLAVTAKNFVKSFHDPARPRRLMPKLRRLFGRAALEKDEINILRGILDSIEKPTGPRWRGTDADIEPIEK